MIALDTVRYKESFVTKSGLTRWLFKWVLLLAIRYPQGFVMCPSDIFSIVYCEIFSFQDF